MMHSHHSRLLTPAIALLAGTAIACALGIRQSWGTALGAEAVALCWATGLYVIGGANSDTGSTIAGREDERQQLVGLRAARLSLAVVFAAIVALCLIAAAVNYEIWPFEALLVIIGIAYFIGLHVYGVDPDERASTPRRTLGLGFVRTNRPPDFSSPVDLGTRARLTLVGPRSVATVLLLRWPWEHGNDQS